RDVNVSTVEPGQTITSLVLTVGNVQNGAAERLFIDGTDISLATSLTGTTAANGMSYTVSTQNGVATITLGKTGGITTTATQTLIDAIGYRNDSEAPGAGARTVTITGIGDSGSTANGGANATALNL